MSDKRTKKSTTKNNKKASKNRKIPTLKLDNWGETPAKTTYIKDTERFKISDIDINKIRVSDKKLYSKEHNSLKYYVFYEHNDNECIPLRIILKDVVGYYNDYKDNSKHSAKRMNFRLDDDSLDKVYDISVHIEEKLGIALNDFTCGNKGEEHLKIIVSDETCFRENKDNIIPSENTKYTCRVLLQIQSVYFNMKDSKGDIRYYPQVLLEQCVCRPFSNNILIHKDLEFTDTEPDFESNHGDESEEEINENTVFDECE